MTALSCFLSPKTSRASGSNCAFGIGWRTGRRSIPIGGGVATKLLIPKSLTSGSGTVKTCLIRSAAGRTHIDPDSKRASMHIPCASENLFALNCPVTDFLKRNPVEFNMSDGARISAECLTPILYVRDFGEAMKYYTEKLLFEKLWDWGDPPTFGAVRLGKVEIFFCLKGQGHPGTWLSIFVDDVDDYFERITRLGAEVIFGPVD